MKVWVQMQNHEERTYDNVVRVDDSDNYKIFIYGERTVLAVINKSDLQNLLTDTNIEAIT